MASRVFPDELIEFTPGEEKDFQFDFVDELDSDTAGSGTVSVINAEGVIVTDEIAPASGDFGAWTLSGTTLTVTFRIPEKGYSPSYLAAFSMTSTTSGEKWKKYLGILVSQPTGVF